MYRKSFSLLVGTGVCAALALAITERQARAEEPTPVVRTFAFFIDAVGMTLPDYEGADSIAVVALPSTSGDIGAMNLASGATSGFPEWLQGTTWRFSPAKHITRGGNDDQGAYVWLVTDEFPDPPPPGSHAFTGLGGSILDVQVYEITPCGSDCSPSSYWYAPAYGGTDIFVVVTAVFSE